MPAVATSAFTGFRPEAIQFLADLAAHNDRSWFQPRKADFERLLKEPLEALCSALAERFAAREIPLRADPARSPFRIYRDVRFARDKSPYKTNVGASFPWAEGQGPGGGARGREGSAAGGTGVGGTGVGGYFHLAPGEVFFGGGMWHPEPARLAAFRRIVADQPGRVHAALEDPGFVEWFGSIGGDRLKRTPTGFPADHPEAELLRLKDVVFSRRLSDDEAASPDLPDRLADGLAAATPVFRLLAGIKQSA
jgi:uncharacterized protein (TIGR02453 family)